MQSEGEGEGVAGEPEEEIIYKYIPPEPKDWVHLGSTKEIEEEALKENRPRVGTCSCFLACCAFEGYELGTIRPLVLSLTDQGPYSATDWSTNDFGH